MKILALEASTEALSAALLDSDTGGAAIEHFEIAPQAHARRLLPVAEALLAQAGWTLAALDAIAFGRGPGAFTGLRIAAGLVQGLAAGLDRPVVPVSTLAALAAGALSAGNAARVQVVTDARMGEIYTADYARATDMPQALAPERVIEPADLVLLEDEAVARAGNGWPLVADARRRAPFEVCVTHPRAGDIARLAQAMLANGGGVPAHDALPVYVRDDVARKPGARWPR